MLTANLRNYIFILSTLWIFACSHIGIQLNKKGTMPPSTPDCQRNCTRGGGLVSHPVYKTWVKFDHLDFENGFDLAVETLRAQGHWILLTDPRSGTVSAQMFMGGKQEGGDPATVKIVPEDKFSLLVHITLKATWGRLTSPNLCGFYDELEKRVKQASSRAQVKQSFSSHQKVSNGKTFDFLS